MHKNKNIRLCCLQFMFEEIQQALTEMLVGLVGAIPKFITALLSLLSGS